MLTNEQFDKAVYFAQTANQMDVRERQLDLIVKDRAELLAEIEALKQPLIGVGAEIVALKEKLSTAKREALLLACKQYCDGCRDGEELILKPAGKERILLYCHKSICTTDNGEKYYCEPDCKAHRLHKLMEEK